MSEPQKIHAPIGSWAWRDKMLEWLRSEPGLMRGAIRYYQNRPDELLEHWGAEPPEELVPRRVLH